MSEFTFLTAEQIFGDNMLDILKKYGTKCAITDFSILLGGYVSADNYTWKNERIGWWWTKSSDGVNDVCVISKIGHRDWCFVNERRGGARPVLPYSSIVSSCSNAIRCRNGILEVEYGEYPQTVVSENLARTLENVYLNGLINRTGKSYTTDSVNYRDKVTPFKARSYIEYEYAGKKYIRFIGDLSCCGKVLSDDRMILIGMPYWVEVEPIKWLIDERANIALSKKLIFSGVQFDQFEIGRYFRGNFDKTTIKEFMDTYFVKDITPILKKEEKELQEKEKIKKNLEELEKLLGNLKEEDVEIEKAVQVLKRVLSKK